MRHYDLAPLYKTTIGFDHLAAVLNSVAGNSGDGYPPYNIERVGENEYRIEMAVAGVAREDIAIELNAQTLTVKARPRDVATDRQFLHRGIATRSFNRRFKLADHVQVVSAALDNGMLSITLSRELPEAMKPRSIAIDDGRNVIDA